MDKVGSGGVLSNVSSAVNIILPKNAKKSCIKKKKATVYEKRVHMFIWYTGAHFTRKLQVVIVIDQKVQKNLRVREMALKDVQNVADTLNVNLT
ncbi:hypothetical protein TELCIR_20897, partial [Teladorsagia circumcincta]